MFCTGAIWLTVSYVCHCSATTENIPLAGARLVMGQMIGATATEDTTLENQAINPIGVVFHTETWSLLRPQSSLFVATHRINAIKPQQLVISLHVS